MDSFFVADEANDGEVLPLFTPDGEKTEHWIKVLGIDSDSYRLAHTRLMRQARQHGDKTDDEKDVLTLDMMADLAASLVADWSFDQPCTQENVLAFLKKARQFVQPINELAGNRQLFFGLKRASSVSSPAQNSN